MSAGGEDRRDLDWALVELDSSTRLLRNSYLNPGSADPVLIEDIGVDNPIPNTRVVVLGGKTGPRDGIIGQGNIDLRVQDRNLIVTQLVLREPLGTPPLVSLSF